jgi:hypothetical protein
MSQDVANETILLGQIDDTLEDHLLDSTNAHPISAISGLQDELDQISSNNYKSTGVIDGGVITKGTGNLDVNISTGSGLIVDAISDPYNITTEIVK